MLAASSRFADCYLLIIALGMQRLTPVTPPVTPPAPLPRAPATTQQTNPPVDPTLTTSPTTLSLSLPALVPIQTPDDHKQEELIRLKAQVEALSRQLQEHQRNPASTPPRKGASTAGRQTRKRPASQVYQEALGRERETEDEREVRRVEKSAKKARTMGGREELDKELPRH